MNTKKRKYKTPKMEVISFFHEQQLLTGSGVGDFDPAVHPSTDDKDDTDLSEDDDEESPAKIYDLWDYDF